MSNFFEENKDFADHTLLVSEDGQSVTYDTWYRFAEQLRERVASRSLVFLLAQNTPGAVLGYLSFIKNGIVPVLLNSRINSDLLNNLLEVYHPEYMYVPEDMKEDFSAYDEVVTAYGYTMLATGFKNETPLFEDLALLLTTSGSTGSPKLVRQSYTNIAANAQSIAEYLKLDENERPITSLPMNYTYGLSIINSHVLVGATILVTDKSFMQKEFWNFFREEKATSFGGVPYNYEILDKLRFYRMDLPSLKTMTQAGGKLSVELHKKFAEHAANTGRNFVVMYGQCEATARMAYLPPDKAVEKAGSMGVVIPGGKFTLVGADGNDVTEPHVTGELVYEGANVTLGYAECREDLAKGDERHGKLETGDMAQMDEDGYYYIVGRKKRFLKIYGNRVNLDETERLLKTKYDNMDCACGGVDDHLIVFLTDASVNGDEVRTYIAETTHLNHAAIRVVTIDAIPHNDAGKTLYSELEKYY